MALVSLACALFPALGAGRVFASSFWLVRWIVCVLCDWSDWFLVLVLRHIFGNCLDCGRPWRPKLFDKVLRKPLKRCEDTKKNKKNCLVLFAICVHRELNYCWVLTFISFSFGIFQVLTEMVASLKEVQGISRVLYDLTSKPPGTTEWEWLKDGSPKQQ